MTISEIESERAALNKRWDILVQKRDDLDAELDSIMDRQKVLTAAEKAALQLQIEAQKAGA